jgi:hypothetical protein
MVLFVLFPGFGVPSVKGWELDKDGFKKLDFLSELKKLGDVYTYTPNVYRYHYHKKYPLDEQQYEKFKEKPIEISMDQFDIEKECKRIYDEIKDYDGKFVPLGHSMGGFFANYFCKLYKKRCLCCVLIESVRFIPKFDKFKSKEKYPNISLEDVKKIVGDIKKNKNIDDNLDKLDDITAYKYVEYIQKSTGKLQIPTLSFDNIKITDTEIEKNNARSCHRIRDYNEEMYRINGDKITVIYFVNTRHFPWRNQIQSDELIRQIRHFIDDLED